MADYFRNPTASAAIGSVDKELYAARKEGRRLRSLRDQGRLTRQELDAARRRFAGLPRRVLENQLR